MDFKEELQGYSSDDLEVILKDQTELYSPKELELIQKRLAEQKAEEQKEKKAVRPARFRCPRCEAVTESVGEKCKCCDYVFKENDFLEQEVDDSTSETDKTVQRPEKPSPSFIIVLVCISLFLAILLCSADYEDVASLLLTFALPIIVILCISYKNEKKEYQRSCELLEKDPEQYKRELENRAKFHAEVVEHLREERERTKVKCPNCGSTDVERISTSSRMLSVAMVGLASGKIGKQYKCNYCKHMW